MKRNQAINLLIDGVHKTTHSDLILEIDEANDLLNYIENIMGMLPPNQNKDEEAPCAVLTEWEKENPNYVWYSSEYNEIMILDNPSDQWYWADFCIQQPRIIYLGEL